jgi:hypothetical protein
MMKIRFLTSLTLLVVLLAACAPAEGATATNPPAAATQPPTAFVPTMTAAAPTLELPTQTAPSEATALPIATSRGPELHATDPTTVSLASGGLQFVEFFRFT